MDKEQMTRERLDKIRDLALQAQTHLSHANALIRELKAAGAKIEAKSADHFEDGARFSFSLRLPFQPPELPKQPDAGSHKIVERECITTASGCECAVCRMHRAGLHSGGAL